MVKIGIIGGSGLNDPNILHKAKEKKVTTPYGEPSSDITTGEINGVEIAMIARHGKQHTIPPTQVNYRANIWALKEEGCTHILATTACGSLKKEIERGHVIIIDQFIDFTRRRALTFHEKFDKEPMHTQMADPFDEDTRRILIETCQELKLDHHNKGTVITIEGPRFSTKAESRMFRSWGADIINMSIAPEAILANEAGIKYAVIAMSTDYDCLFDDVPPVTWEEVFKVFKENVEKVKQLIIESIPKIK